MPQGASTLTQDWFRHEPFPLSISKPIRLLRILPGSRQPIRCRIQAYDTNQGIPMEYLCLSYQWGPEEPEDEMRVIELNGSRFRVRKNLWGFLYTARFKSNASGSEYSNVQWWIDAICIDQTNVAEKSQQVQLMGEIYLRAKCVILWLGRGDPRLSSSSGVLCLQSCIFRERYAQLAKPDKHIPDRVTGSSPRFWRPTRRQLALLTHATSSNYWTRAWVIQEILLAREVLIWEGDMQLEFDFLRHLFETALEACKMLIANGNLEEKTSLISNWPMTLLLKSRQTDSWNRRNLSNLLRAHRHLQCADRRDRVYSLLSLAKVGPQIRPNYGADCLALFFEVLWACRNEFCLCLSVVLLDVLELGEHVEQHALKSMPGPRCSISVDSEPYIEITSELARSTGIVEPGNLLDVLRLHDIFTCSCHRVRRQLNEWLPGSDRTFRLLLYCFESVLGMRIPLHIAFTDYGAKIMPHGIYDGQWHDAQWRRVQPQEMPCELGLADPKRDQPYTRPMALRIPVLTLLHLAKMISESPVYSINAFSFTCTHYAPSKVLYDFRPHFPGGTS